MRTGAILVVIDQFRRWDPRGRVNPTEPLSLFVVAGFAAAGCRRGHQLAPCCAVCCGVVWWCGRRRPGWPAVPGSGIFSGGDALDWRHRSGREVRISGGQRHGMDGVWAGSTHASRSSSTSPARVPEEGMPSMGSVGFGVLRACRRVQACCSTTQINQLKAREGSVARRICGCSVF